MHISGALSLSTSLPSLPSSSTLHSANSSYLSFPSSAVCLTWGNRGALLAPLLPVSSAMCLQRASGCCRRDSFILPSLRDQSLTLPGAQYRKRHISYVSSSFLFAYKVGCKFCALTPLHCGQGLLCDIFAHPLLLGLSIYYILILYFPYHHPGIRHHPSKLWFLFIREWYLETKVCFLLLRHHCFHTPSPNREEENYTNTHLKKKKRLIQMNFYFISF